MDAFSFKQVEVADLLTVSHLPVADFVINPYVGCMHGCKYCYAEFMIRFTGHAGEKWGSFIDEKIPKRALNFAKIKGKSVVFGSVTDPYQAIEGKCLATRKILEQLVRTPEAQEAHLEIVTKSDLVLRDLDLLKQFKDVTVSMSLNNLDENFRRLVEPVAPSSERRLWALAELHQAGIRTTLFISPIFPELTPVEAIIERAREHIDHIYFENLNLRAGYKPQILRIIAQHYPEYEKLYQQIYVTKEIQYWDEAWQKIERYLKKQGIKDYTNFFYHDQIKKK